MSTTITLNQPLRAEYTELFHNCTLHPHQKADVHRLVDRILSQQARYRSLSGITRVPWYVVAAMHAMEASLRFERHLHNGDPLHAKTTRIPANRPPGNPPFTWEESALDALQFDGFTGWSDWSLPGILYKLEAYNGWGYRKYHPQILSPYLWSFSCHYAKGKYAADGRFDPELVSRQCGAATLLKALEERGVDMFDARGLEESMQGTEPVYYPGGLIRQGMMNSRYVRLIQQRLNTLGCARPLLAVDGDFGSKTEAAVRLFQARSEDSSGDPLVIDGIVGPLTWETLFGTKAVSQVQASPGQTPLLAAVLDTAQNEIGVLEDPLGSNRGKRVEEYLASTDLPGGHPWCAAFVYWCFQQAALRLENDNPCIKTAGVLDHWNQAGQEGVRRITSQQAEEDPELVQPGMVFIIDTGDPGGGGHTGLVERVEGGRLITIEGNTNKDGGREGNGVFRRRRRKVRLINKGFIDYGRGMHRV
ncbi:MAG: CHAP domain-containing protein [Desulfovermiculus sp.]